MRPASLSAPKDDSTEEGAAASVEWAGVAKALQCVERALRFVLVTLFWLLTLTRTLEFPSFWL